MQQNLYQYRAIWVETFNLCSNTRGFVLNLLIFKLLQRSLRNVNSIFAWFCKLYGCKFVIFKPKSHLQTADQGQKPGIFTPTPPFGIANEKAFSNQNKGLAKYQFWFSERSTRFPCDFLQQPRRLIEIPQFERFQRSDTFSII